MEKLTIILLGFLFFCEKNNLLIVYASFTIEICKIECTNTAGHSPLYYCPCLCDIALDRNNLQDGGGCHCLALSLKGYSPWWGSLGG